MKLIRKPSFKRSLKARSPVTKLKRKYSVKKYTEPVKTQKKRLYSKVYNKATFSIWDLFK